MDRINSFIIRLQNRKQEGQGMVEYALVLGLVAIGSIAALTALSGDISTVLGNVGTELTTIDFTPPAS